MSNPSRVVVSGRLSVFVPGFREHLLRRGYSPGAAAKQLQLMAHLSRWLAARDVEPAALGRAQIARFVQERRASQTELASTRALQPLLGYLRSLGVVPPAGSRAAPTPAGALLDRYAEHLLVRRGLNPSTVRNYCNDARAFLADRERIAGDLALGALDDAARRVKPAGGRPGATSSQPRDHLDLRQGRPARAGRRRAAVAEGRGMTALERHVADYLAVRRGMGFKLNNEQRMLADFAAFMDSAGASTLTVDLALGWATLPTGVGDAYLAQRMRTVRGFARYLHGIDPATEIPPLQLLPARKHRPAPHIYSDAEIAALMIAARALRPAKRADKRMAGAKQPLSHRAVTTRLANRPRAPVGGERWVEERAHGAIHADQTSRPT
jgi:hypothetical protein